MAEEFGEYSEFSELNALGNPSKVMYAKAADGGHAGVGPIGNTRPTGIVAEGISIDVGKKDEYTAIREGMSTGKNKDAKSMSSRK
jgi:hypothetical protein